MDKVLMEKDEKICTIVLNRPESRNAVDGETARKLAEKFWDFEEDDEFNAAVLWGERGKFLQWRGLKGI